MLQVTVGADRLEQRLEVENTGDAPLSFTTALHTYYTVSGIQNVLAHALLRTCADVVVFRCRYAIRLGIMHPSSGLHLERYVNNKSLALHLTKRVKASTAKSLKPRA